MVKRDSIEQSTSTLPPPWDRIFSLGSRLFVWGLLFTILYILRPFFLLVFLTFVVAYILEHGVEGLQHRIPNRTVRVVLVAVVFLGTLITIGVALAGPFRRQATTLSENYPQYMASIDAELHKVRTKYKWARNVLPENLRAEDVLEYFLGFVSDQDEAGIAAEADAAGSGDAAGAGEGRNPPIGPRAPGGAAAAEPPDAPPETTQGGTPRDPGGEDPAPAGGAEPGGDRGSTVEARDALAATGEPGQGDGDAAPGAAPPTSRKRIADAVELLKNIASPILGVGSAFLLSLLFSFLIVLDLPKLRRGVTGLANTKIGFIYDEVADNIRDFGKMLGRALEAQLLIAICNTILTGIGLWILGLHSNLVFLLTIVFFCSFIPVAGVFISSVPICLQALSDSGVQLMLLAIVMILIVHFIEAYFLNPRIFGHHLHMNPVLVLIVLTIAGKLFGIWGLVLGLPVVNYVFGHAIRYKQPQKDAPGVAA